MTLDQELAELEANVRIKKLAVRHEAARLRVQSDKGDAAMAEYKALSKELAEARQAARRAGITLAATAGVPAPAIPEKKGWWK